MRIKDNSYYIRYAVYPDGHESANFVHYIKVYDDGFAIDDFTADKNCLSYEDADHSGINPDECFAGTRIFRRYFDRWVKRIDECKLEIEKLVNIHSKPYGKTWMEGDYLYFPLKEIHAEEEAKEAEEFPDEYEEYENQYCGPELDLLHITNIESGNISGYFVTMGEYYTRHFEATPIIIENCLAFKESTRLIPKEVFEKVIELISEVSSDIMAEIKGMVNKIEYR